MLMTYSSSQLKYLECVKRCPLIPQKKQKTNKPWFNAACKNSKANYKRFKKTLPNQQSDADQTNLKNLAKKHNKLLRKEKRKYEKKLNANLK